MKKHPVYGNLLQFDLFDDDKRIVNFSTTRIGGVSEGAYSSFNMGNFSDDSPLNIRENRNILVRMFYMDVGRFIIPHQTHGDKVLTINRDFLGLDLSKATELLYGTDATITAEKEVFLCVTTADCVPLILYDPKKEVIAAVHAGWRGTVQRIVEKTVSEMERQFGSSPSDLMAGIGPAICLSHYEIGEEVVQRFLDEGFDLSDPAVIQGKIALDGARVDLKEINRRELLRLGVPGNRIEKTDFCTYERDDLFFSARRQSVHSGRMLTGIMMTTNQGNPLDED